MPKFDNTFDTALRHLLAGGYVTRTAWCGPKYGRVRSFAGVPALVLKAGELSYAHSSVEVALSAWSYGSNDWILLDENPEITRLREELADTKCELIKYKEGLPKSGDGLPLYIGQLVLLDDDPALVEGFYPFTNPHMTGSETCVVLRMSKTGSRQQVSAARIHANVKLQAKKDE